MSAVLDIAIVEDWESPKWRLNNIYQIVDAQGQLIPFRMKPEQEQLFDEMWYWNLVLKARQMGFSTFIDLMALDQCLFVPSFRAGIIAQTEPDVLKLFKNKIEKPYLALPQELRDAKGLVRKNATEIEFGNGSSLQVGMSMRSDTLQFLHVSEFGKICAKAPGRAKEVVTGAFPTLAVGCPLFVESTAEGSVGYYHDYCMDALAAQQSGAKLSKRSFKLHFYAWFEKPENRLDPDTVVLNANDHRYFELLEAEHGITVDDEQKAWYVNESRTIKGDMHRENPSYPEEAFAARIEGAFYEREMLYLRKHGRIGDVPWQADLPVDTYWDFGVSKNNETTIWFCQRNGLADCFIKYLEAEGQGIRYFVNELEKLPYTWGTDYLPHDGRARVQAEEAETREQILNRLGRKNTVIVPRVQDVMNGIELTRGKMSSVWMDRENCKEGISALDNYVPEWDEARQQFRAKPLHNWASNGADSFRQWGQADRRYTPRNATHQPPKKTAVRSWKVA